MQQPQIETLVSQADYEAIANRLTVSSRERTRREIAAQTDAYLKSGRTITHLSSGAHVSYGNWDDVDEDLFMYRENKDEAEKRKKSRDKWNLSGANKTADKPNKGKIKS